MRVRESTLCVLLRVCSLFVSILVGVVDEASGRLVQ